MNLIDAVKSGRPFRRKSDPNPGQRYSSEIYSYDADDILADDWEIQEPTVTITRSQADAAILCAVEYLACSRGLFSRLFSKDVDTMEMFSSVRKKLGFEN